MRKEVKYGIIGGIIGACLSSALSSAVVGFLRHPQPDVIVINTDDSSILMDGEVAGEEVIEKLGEVFEIESYGIGDDRSLVVRSHGHVDAEVLDDVQEVLDELLDDGTIDKVTTSFDEETGVLDLNLVLSEE